MKNAYVLISLMLVGCGQVEGLQDIAPTESKKEIAQTPVAACASEETDEGVLITCANDEKPTLVRHGRVGAKGDKGDAGETVEAVVIEHTIETVVEHTVETQTVVEHTLETQTVVEHTTETVVEQVSEVGVKKVSVLSAALNVIGEAYWLEATHWFVIINNALVALQPTSGAVITAKMFFSGPNCSGDVRVQYYDAASQKTQVYHDINLNQFVKIGAKSPMAYQSIQMRDGVSACGNAVGNASQGRVFTQVEMPAGYPYGQLEFAIVD